MGNTLYIVDYDIPEEPVKERVQFYRDLKRLHVRKKEYSTLSVICTEKEHLAIAVYFLVRAHNGNAHMYEAREIDPMKCCHLV